MSINATWWICLSHSRNFWCLLKNKFPSSFVSATDDLVMVPCWLIIDAILRTDSSYTASVLLWKLCTFCNPICKASLAWTSWTWNSTYASSLTAALECHHYGSKLRNPKKSCVQKPIKNWPDHCWNKINQHQNIITDIKHIFILTTIKPAWFSLGQKFKTSIIIAICSIFSEWRK